MIFKTRFATGLPCRGRGYRPRIFPALLCLIFFAFAVDTRIFATVLEVAFKDGRNIVASKDSVELTIDALAHVPPSKEHGIAQLSLKISLHRITDSIGRDIRSSEKPKELHTDSDLLERIQRTSNHPFSFPAPEAEGVYEMIVQIHQRGGVGVPKESRWALGTNPLQRPVGERILAEVVRQFVVLDPNATSRPVGDWKDLLDKKLVETVDVLNPAWKKRWAPIPAFSKVGSLASAKLPERSTLAVLRERQNQGSEHNRTVDRFDVASTSENEQKNEPVSPATSSRPNSNGLERCVSELIRQLDKQAGGQVAGPLGSGHLERPGVSNGLPLLGEKKSLPEFWCLKPAEPGSVGIGFETSWEALPLNGVEPDTSFLLEIDYPVTEPQQLAVIVLTLPGDSKEFPMPRIIARSMIRTAEEIVNESASGKATHRIVFRPETQQAVLLLSNLDTKRKARFGEIRLYRLSEPGPSHSAIDLSILKKSPPTGSSVNWPKPFADNPKRLVVAKIEDDAFFGAKINEERSARGFWNDCYFEAKQLIERLHRGAYDGAVLNVASNRSDDKNALDLLLQLFDRERLTLIPSVRFSMPLSALEDRRQQPDPTWELFYTDSNGIPIIDEPRQYNLLHPVVQEAMLQVVDELVGRCAKHSCFGGISIELSTQGYAVLPGSLVGMDDLTIRQFELETGIDLPDEITTKQPNGDWQNPAERERYFRTNSKFAEIRTDWRCRKVTEFYERLAHRVATIRPDVKVYLAGESLFDVPESKERLEPMLESAIPRPSVLRRVGLDLTRLSRSPNLVFLKPIRLTSENLSEVCGLDLRCSSNPDKNGSACLLFRQDEASGLTSTLSARQARRRFVRQLAKEDVALFVDAFPELNDNVEEYATDFIAAYRQLPERRFETYQTPRASDDTHSDGIGTESIQPLTIRHLRTPAGLFVYVLNDAPFAVKAQIRFKFGTQSGDPGKVVEITNGSPALASTHLVSLGKNTLPGQADCAGDLLLWRVEIEAFDFLAVCLNAPAVTIQDVFVDRPDSICGRTGELAKRIELLRQHVRTAQRGIAWNELQNADFEQPREQPQHDQTDLIGWETFGGPSFRAERDIIIRKDDIRNPVAQSSGHARLKLTNESFREAGAVYSTPFKAPGTGRLFVSLAVGLTDENDSIPFDVVLAGRRNGEPFIRPGVQSCLQSGKGGPVSSKTQDIAMSDRPIAWQTVLVPFDPLPCEGIDELRLGFALTSPATVWIDDIKLYSLAFTRDEMNVLYRLLSVADRRFQTGRVSDLLSILEGYWPQYLAKHISEESIRQVNDRAELLRVSGNTLQPDIANPTSKTARAVGTKMPPPSPSTGFFDRVKGWFGR